jgi:proline iminopeptidase
MAYPRSSTTDRHHPDGPRATGGRFVGRGRAGMGAGSDTTWARDHAVAVVSVAAFALASGVTMPRGPVTSGEALATMLVAALVGLLVGAASGRRWSVLAAPVVFVLVFELARLGASGPTVDVLSGNGILPWMAFLLGRLVHGVVAIGPLVVGTLLGIEVAARRGSRRARPLRAAAWVATVALALALVAFAGAVARPPTTAPILGPDGRPLAGSVAELTTLTIGGHEQALMIRGRSGDLPVLLHLAGGPGGTDIGAMRLDTGLESHFVVVTWDQRGTGKSYPAFDPSETLTLEQVVSDTIELSERLRARFGQERIYLAGQSWGTIPATLAVQRRPELYHALIATGMMVNVLETDRIFYQETLDWAGRSGDASLAARLRDLGPPPYRDLLTTYPLIVAAERALNPYPEFDGRSEMTASIWVPEYGLMEQVNALRGLADTYARLYPQIQGLDFRRDVVRLEVPLYLVMGAHEAAGRVRPAQAWFEALEAPLKRWVVFEGASHRANFERPAEYARLLEGVVTETASRAAPGFGFIRGIDRTGGVLDLASFATLWQEGAPAPWRHLRDVPYHFDHDADGVVAAVREQDLR